MQTTVRTTIRVRKDLLDQSRMLALQRGVSLQDVINETLTLGFGHISDLKVQRNALANIDQFRENLKGQKIDLQKILKESKKDLK